MAQQIEYDSKQKQLIHQLIAAVFSGQALNQFCATHFRPVFDKFTPELDTPSKIRLLIEYCARGGQLGTLVAKIEQAQPEAYQAFVQQVQASPPKSIPTAPPAAPETPPRVPAATKVSAQPEVPDRVEKLLTSVLSDRYRLDELLDRSGLGAVFKAYDLKLNLEVALKVIELDRVKQATRLELIRQKARTAMQLDYPGLVQVYDFGEVDTLFYIVEEFVPGSNLREVRRNIGEIEPRPLWSQALQLVHQLCLTVDYLHQQGLLQPSLAPDNIMFKPNPGAEELAWQPILTNVALLQPQKERLLSDQELPADRLTFHVSPELLLGQMTDIRSDVYALGVLLYYLVVGQPPFQPINLTQAMRLHVETAPTPPGSVVPGLPEAIESIILKALSKNPAERYPTARTMAQAVADGLGTLRLPPMVHRADIAMLGMDQPLTVAPGQQLSTSLTLRNEGKQAHYCQIRIEGIPTNWVSIAPSAITLAPGEMREIALTIEPPRAPLSRAGRHSLAIQVLSQEKLGQRNEITRVLTVSPYTQFKSGLWPQEISAGQTVQVTVENQGNYAETFTVTPKPDQNLTFEPNRLQLQVSAGEQATTDFQVAPGRRVWVGKRTTHTFSFQVDSPQGSAEVISGQLSSQGLLTPEWAFGVILALLLCACAAIATYFSIDYWLSAEPTPVIPTADLSTPVPPVEPPTAEVATATPTFEPTLEPQPPTTEPPTETPTVTSTPQLTVIPSPGQSPVSVILAPREGEVGQTITFDAGNSRPADQIVSYAWQLGDGTTANAVIINHIYQTTGTFNVILTVTDGTGLTDTSNHAIQIIEPTPTDTPEPEPTQESP